MSLLPVLNGAVIMGYAVASVFFLKFWRRTGDRLFLAFFASFLLLAAVPLLTAWLNIPREEQSAVYLLRAAAFMIIIVAILINSRRSSP
jgi:membrane protein CcdC involved in cytochrome C biogenesis